MNRKSCFTLIELLVVIAIIAILASMLLPALSKARARAQNITCVSNQKECGMAFLMYGNDNNGIMPLIRKYNTSYHFWSEILNQENHLPGKNILQCPSILPRRYIARNYTYGITTLAADFPSAGGIRVQETTANGYFIYILPEKSAKPSQLAVMAESVNEWLVAANGLPAAWISIYEWRLSAAPAASGTTYAAHFRHDGRANFLYSDGHAASQTLNEYAKDAKTRVNSTVTTVYGRDLFFAVKSVVIN
ncbi:MAG: prepilin-type N-terminal cleavage/methylation domain-containing protein [Lentisphaeria bacterium]